MKLKTLKDFETKEAIPTMVGGHVMKITDCHTVSKEELKQEAIKWVKLLLKIINTKIIKMPEIKLTKKGIDVRHGHFDGQCMGANHQLKNEFYSALILCKMYDLTEEDLK